MSVLLFFLVLFVLVLVHEWGHFIVAKKTGMRVDEFAIGFPPKLFGVRKGETVYNFNALPIGGYVKIFGENAEAIETEDDKRDEARAFYARPKWAQALVLLAGITMNILFAWLLFTSTLVIGVPSSVDEATAGPDAELLVAGTLKGAPADGVLPIGAVIVGAKAGDTRLEQLTPSAFSSFIASHEKEPIAVEYKKAGIVDTVTITPAAGLVPDNPEKHIVGTTLSLVETKQESFPQAVAEGAEMTVQGIINIAVGLFSLIRDAFVGQADFSSVAGPIGIVGLVGDAASYGVTSLLLFTAIISLNLAVINVLPFPALDGGRLMFVMVEAITKRRIPPQVAGWANLIGFALLMVLMAAVTINDVHRLL